MRRVRGGMDGRKDGDREERSGERRGEEHDDARGRPPLLLLSLVSSLLACLISFLLLVSFLAVSLSIYYSLAFLRSGWPGLPPLFSLLSFRCQPPNGKNLRSPLAILAIAIYAPPLPSPTFWWRVNPTYLKFYTCTCWVSILLARTTFLEQGFPYPR